MDSFLRLYAIYRSVTRWQIIVRVYSESDAKWKVGLWSTKLAFVAFSVIGFLTTSWHPYFLVLVAVGIAWAWLFCKARTLVFSEAHRLYPERMKYFAMSYQYLRYLGFREKVKASGSLESVPTALAFVNGQLETDSHISLSSHPLITFSLGTILAVLGGAAGQWNVEYVTAAILIMGTVAYFSYMILDVNRSPESGLKEFKRFLLWVRDEPTEN